MLHEDDGWERDQASRALIMDKDTNKPKPPPELEDLYTQEGYELALRHKGFIPRSEKGDYTCWERLSYRPLEGPLLKAADIWKRTKEAVEIGDEASYQYDDPQIREAWKAEEENYWNQIGKECIADIGAQETSRRLLGVDQVEIDQWREVEVGFMHKMAQVCNERFGPSVEICLMISNISKAIMKEKCIADEKNQ